MFGVTANEDGAESEQFYKELVNVQKELLTELGLHGQVCGVWYIPSMEN